MFVRCHVLSLDILYLVTMAASGTTADDGNFVSVVGRMNDALARFGATVVVVPR